jgi:hypothetical protein
MSSCAARHLAHLNRLSPKVLAIELPVKQQGRSFQMSEDALRGWFWAGVIVFALWDL